MLMSFSSLFWSGCFPFSGTNTIILFILLLNFSYPFLVDTFKIKIYLHLFINAGAHSIIWLIAIDHKNYTAPLYLVDYAISERIKKAFIYVIDWAGMCYMSDTGLCKTGYRSASGRLGQDGFLLVWRWG